MPILPRTQQSPGNAMTGGRGCAVLNRKPLSVYAGLAVGLILVIEPTLPQYHFSPLWFSLEVASLIVPVRDPFRKP